MISYDNVIVKRLRFKGEETESDGVVEDMSSTAKPTAMESFVEAPSLASIGDLTPRDVNEVILAPEQHLLAESTLDAKDTRTEAERHFENRALEREKEQLRKAASTSHRDQVDKFNAKLAKEPEHYDLFKISFTK